MLSTEQLFSKQRVEARDQREIALPTARKKLIIAGSHASKFLTDGRVNTHYSVKSPAVAYNSDTGHSVMLFQGKEPRFIKDSDGVHLRVSTNAIYGATSPDDWDTVNFFDSSSGDISVMTDAIPLFSSSDTTGILAKNGHIDPRVNIFSPTPGTNVYFVTVSAFNGERFEYSRKLAGKDMTKPVDGGRLELFCTSDLTDPHSFRPLGFVGPEEYFRNVLIHPVPVIKDGVETMMIIGRKMPGIQAYYLPLTDFSRLISDEGFRKEFWGTQLDPDVVKKQTIMEPMFPWEGKENENNPLGQIAGGAPPFTVSHYDAKLGKEMKYWQLIYNAVPEFNSNLRGTSRVVGAALLDYDDPQKVIARSPQPIIIPSTTAEFAGDVSNVAFATGAYVDNQRYMNIFYSAADTNIMVTQFQLDPFINYMLQYDQYGQLK